MTFGKNFVPTQKDTFCILGMLLAFPLFSTSPQAATILPTPSPSPKEIRFSGKLNDLENKTKEVVFERKIQISEEEMQIFTTYSLPGKKKAPTILATEKGTYKKTKDDHWIVGEYIQTKNQEEETCSVRQVPGTGDNRTHVYQFEKTDRKGTRRRQDKLNHWALTPDLLIPYVREHLDQLKKNSDSLPIKLLVPCRLDAYSFTFSLQSRTADEIRLKLRASNILIAALAPEFEFVLSAREMGRLLRYKGRVLPLREVTKKGASTNAIPRYEEYEGILEITEVKQSPPGA